MSSQPSELNPAPAKFVVLCADEAAREKLAYWLNETGTVVNVALSGYHARQLLERSSAALLITDRLLPPWPGLDTIVNLKTDLAGIKVAFIDDGVPDNSTLALSAGADIVLPKPLRRATVLKACLLPRSSFGGLACVS